jgi:hypothetical protein
VLAEARYYLRMARYYGEYVRTGPPLDPEDMLRRSAARRDTNFLGLVQHDVFENPRTPYYHLLRRAGCTFRDLEESVRREGLEGTLERLRAEGVYLTHDEVKGGTVRRGSTEIANDPAATARPNSPGGLESISSGSRSKGTATLASNAYRRHREAYEMLARKEWGVAGRATAVLQSVLPAPGGLIASTSLHHCGQPAEHWFAIGKSWREEFHYRFVTAFLAAEARVLGCHVPLPEYLPPNEFGRVVHWIVSVKRSGRLAFIRSGVSSATRVCGAAMERGLDISGTLFSTTGEGITEARRRLFDAAGVTAYGRYVISEIGTIGTTCRHVTGNSVHLFDDTAAIIVHRRPAPYADADVNALLFTTVHPDVSRVFINADMEDGGTLHPVRCDCTFSRVGYRTIIQDVQSFGKLSAHSMVLAGPPLLRILEDALPHRFGGAPGDFQLVEQEGRAQKELRLRVSPRLGSLDSATVQDFFLRQIKTLYGGNVSQRVWRATETFQVEVGEPYRTRTGKVHPIHLATFTANRVETGESTLQV